MDNTINCFGLSDEATDSEANKVNREKKDFTTFVDRLFNSII